jgi:hypothetical protein
MSTIPLLILSVAKALPHWSGTQPLNSGSSGKVPRSAREEDLV